MKIQSSPPPPQQPQPSSPKPPQDPEPSSFGDRFTAAADRAGAAGIDILAPATLAVVGGGLGWSLGVARLGPSTPSFLLSMIGLVGGFATGQAAADGCHAAVDHLAGSGKFAQAVGSTAVASVLGGALAGSLAGFQAVNVCTGAALTLTGVGAFSAGQAALAH